MRADEFTLGDLQIIHEPTDTGSIQISAMLDGKEIAFVRFQPVDDKKHKASFVFVPKRLRRRGIGSAMYRYAREKLGLDLIASPNQTDLGKKFWSKVHENKPINYIDNNLWGGSLDGYVSDTDQVNFRNYLEGKGVDDSIINHIAKKYSRIGLIRNIYVDEEMRGQGIGNNLVSSAIQEAYRKGAEAIILVADMDETNNINLEKWYQGFRFQTIGKAGTNPLMLLEL